MYTFLSNLIIIILNINIKIYFMVILFSLFRILQWVNVFCTLGKRDTCERDILRKGHFAKDILMEFLSPVDILRLRLIRIINNISFSSFLYLVKIFIDRFEFNCFSLFKENVNKVRHLVSPLVSVSMTC